MSKVSVIIPNYNNSRWLHGCLNSVIKQGELVKEIIVVDDCSTDNSVQLLEEFKKKSTKTLKIFTNPGKGANSARNFGFEQSSGDYIQWLDSDDYILEGKFQAQIKELENATADIAYSDFRMDYYNDGSIVSSETKSFDGIDDYLLELIKDYWNVCHSYLITREFAKKLSSGIGWNAETQVAQDREYFTMAGILGACFVYAKGNYAVYNKHSSNTISEMDFQRRLELNQVLEKRFREEIERSDSLTKEKKKPILRC